MTNISIFLILIIIILGCLGLYYVFQKESYDNLNFDKKWREVLLNEVLFYQHLIPSERVRFEVDITKFISNVRITGVDTEISVKDRMLVASSAVIPLFGYPGSSFDNISDYA